MKLYHFSHPLDYRFARAGRLGTWETPPGPGLCPECHRTNELRTHPLIVEWLPDSDVVGDFAWPGLNDEIVVSQRVREAFEQRFSGLEFFAIEMFQEPRLKRPERPNKRTKPRVWLPYTGPTLWNMQSTCWCHLDHWKSGIEVVEGCSMCGRGKYRTPRFDDRHLVIDPQSWHGEDIFHIHEYSGWLFCTENVKQLVEAHGFTNAGFALDGEVPT